jgi:anti-sigma regulatory factor (Ser/Thr protein kinase)
MTGENTATFEPQLTIQSRLDDLSLVWSWVETLADLYSIPAEVQFAIQLCLEEALSNIIRHGYGGQPNHAININCSRAGANDLAFILEDHAPPFDPLEYSAIDESPVPASIDQLQVGGQGIRLLRKFAGGLAYQRLPGGNRLTINVTIRT